MAMSGLHTHYWVWSGPKLWLTVLEEVLGDAYVHHMGKQHTEKWSSSGGKNSSVRIYFGLILLLGILTDGCALRTPCFLAREMLLKH